MTPAEMTITECGELVQYAKGGRFSGTARRMLGEFLHARGWYTQTEWNEAICVATERWDNRSPMHKMLGSPVYCETCGKKAVGVRPNGGWSCRDHWDLDREDPPKFDMATGFALTDAAADIHVT